MFALFYNNERRTNHYGKNNHECTGTVRTDEDQSPQSIRELLPHTPECLSTIQIPCDWKDTPAPTPIFDKYLQTLINSDKAVAQLLMEFIGVCISNVKGWRMKKALFLVGAGDTGKSQLKSLVERLLGNDNFIGIDLKEIEARFGTGAIYGTRLAGSSDMSFLSVDELKTFKQVKMVPTAMQNCCRGHFLFHLFTPFYYAFLMPFRNHFAELSPNKSRKSIANTAFSEPALQ